MILSFHVYTTRDGGLWLTDEGRFTSRFLASAEFSTEEAANEAIGACRKQRDDTFYVFACMGS